MNNVFYSNFAEGAKILLEHGADINSKDGRHNTATMAAGALGHYDVLKILLDHHLLNIHAGVRNCEQAVVTTICFSCLELCVPAYVWIFTYMYNV